MAILPPRCVHARCVPQTAQCVDCDRELLHLCFIYGNNTLQNCVIHTNLHTNTHQQRMAWLTIKLSRLGAGGTEDNLALLKCLNTGGPFHNLKKTELEKVKDTTTTTKKQLKKNIKSPELVMKAADRGETGRSIRDCCLL